MCLLVQTNSNLDLGMGIYSKDVNGVIFGNNTQTDAVFASRGERTATQVAINLSVNRSKKDACLIMLNLAPFNSVICFGSYALFMDYEASQSDSAIHVAGILEAVMAFIFKKRTLPLGRISQKPPKPQRLVDRLLLPGEAAQGRLRVISQFRAARLHKASNFADLFGWLMFARRGWCRCTPPPLTQSHTYSLTAGQPPYTRLQLKLGAQWARAVNEKAPGVEFWKHSDAISVELATTPRSETFRQRKLGKGSRTLPRSLRFGSGRMPIRFTSWILRAAFCGHRRTRRNSRRSRAFCQLIRSLRPKSWHLLACISWWRLPWTSGHCRSRRCGQRYSLIRGATIASQI